MIILSRSNSHSNLLFFFCADCVVFCVISKVTEFLMSSRSIIGIYDYFFAMLLATKVSLLIAIFGVGFSLFMAILTRTNSNFYSLIALLANRMIFGVITKISKLLMSSRSIIWIYDCFFVMLLASKVSLLVAIFSVSVSLFMIIGTGADCNSNFLVTLLTN